jgi:hypothetical protein
MTLKNSPYTGVVIAISLSLVVFRFCSTDQSNTNISKPDSDNKMSNEQNEFESATTIRNNKSLNFTPKIDLTRTLEVFDSINTKMEQNQKEARDAMNKKIQTDHWDSLHAPPFEVFETIKKATRESEKKEELLKGFEYDNGLNIKLQTDSLK